MPYKASLEEQERIFIAQIAFAEKFTKPVTLHIVRCFDRLLRIKKQLNPTTQWTVHGFRGKPALAEQLLQAGLNLSFGTHYNSQSYEITLPIAAIAKQMTNDKLNNIKAQSAP